MYSTYLTLFFLIYFFPFIITITLKDLDSPCPQVFKYLSYSSIDRTWYGELTILRETNFTGTEILITFDTPPKFVGTIYGSVIRIDEKTYSIVNLDETLIAQISPNMIQFYVVHAYLKLPAKLVSIKLNSEDLCYKKLLIDIGDNGTTTGKILSEMFRINSPSGLISTNIYFLGDFNFEVRHRYNTTKAECYDVVVYESNNGTLTMLSKTNTDKSEGVWMRLFFDASVELSSSYGNVISIDDRTYVIQNLDDQLIGDKPKRVRFSLKYDRSKPIPNLLSFHHAGTQVCSPYFFQNSKLPVKNADQDYTNGTVETQEFNIQILDIEISRNATVFDTTKLIGNDISCGTVAIRPKLFLSYGEDTYEGEFPWHVALYRLTGVELKYTCGASLISNSFVITAAHCATYPRRTMSLNAENLIAYLGKHYLSQNSKDTIQDKRISEIIIHPKYNANNFSNDIALLKLALPAEYNDYVRPVCLWQDSINLNEILNIPGNVVGWGSDETGHLSDQLMQAFMPVVSLGTCLDSFREFYGRYITSNNYCAGFKNGTSVCTGDSGGGMVFPKSNSNPKYPIWQLRGLVSLGPTAQSKNFKCDTSNYVIFTDIAKYLDWIQNIIN